MYLTDQQAYIVDTTVAVRQCQFATKVKQLAAEHQHKRREDLPQWQSSYRP